MAFMTLSFPKIISAPARRGALIPAKTTFGFLRVLCGEKYLRGDWRFDPEQKFAARVRRGWRTRKC
jgi:hypothetical protein